MTFALLVVGAAGAAIGTRFAAVAFIGAAAAAFSDDALMAATPVGAGTLAAIVVWSAATAAAWLLLTRETPRRIGLPAFGLAAVLVAGAAPNAAVLLGCWVLGTAAAVLSRSTGETADRWALSLCVVDLFLVGAVASAVGRGFEGWPATLGAPGVIALIVSALARAPLAAGPDDATPMPGLLIVRAQSAVLAYLALVAASVDVAEGALVVGAAAFAAAPWAASRPRVADVVQEQSLLLIAVAGVRLGWGAPGWVWGVLIGGTLIHQLRFRMGRSTFGPTAAVLLMSAGIGLPLLPAIVAQLDAATSAPRWIAAVLLVGLLAGLARRPALAEPVARRGSGLAEEIRTLVVVVAALIAAVVTVAYSAPQPPAVSSPAGPELWAGVAVLLAAAAGARVPRVVGRDRAASWRPTWPGPVVEAAAFADRVATGRVVWAALGVLGIAAALTWVVGLARGFL